MTDEQPSYGGQFFARVSKDLPGTGRLTQVWVLRAQCEPGEDLHHATVQCYVGDINIVGNQRLPSEGDKTLRDPGVSGWKNVPEDVKEELAKLVPEGTTVLDGDGGEVEL